MRAAQRREGEACTELYALDGGNAEQHGRKTALYAVEHRAADAGRKADRRAFNDAADRILLLACVHDRGQHGLKRTGIVDRILGVPQRFELLGRYLNVVERHILNLCDGLDVRADRDTLLTQPQLGQCARREKCPPPRGSLQDL